MAADKDPSIARPAGRLRVFPAFYLYFPEKLPIIQGIEPNTLEKVKDKVLKNLPGDTLDLLGRPGLAEGKVKMGQGSAAGPGLKPVGQITQPVCPGFTRFIRKPLCPSLHRTQGQRVKEPAHPFQPFP
jgi:hypothetical protein